MNIGTTSVDALHFQSCFSSSSPKERKAGVVRALEPE